MIPASNRSKILATKSHVAVFSVVLLLAVGYSCATLADTAKSNFRAPGWGELSYTAPAPGTYELPPIMPAADGVVLKTDYSTVSLHELMADKLVLLSFIFTRCSDENGCPLANAVLYKIQSRLNGRPELANEVALLSISFDPDFDTPEVTGQYQSAYVKKNVNWKFLTTRGQSELQPILDGYGQFAVRVNDGHDEHGRQAADYVHFLKVYLIDRERQVRNIYSVSFLHADILMNDLETLFLESALN